MTLKVTLYYKINDCHNQTLYRILKKRLTLEKKESIKSWVLEIQSWRFPPKIVQLQKIATELL